MRGIYLRTQDSDNFTTNWGLHCRTSFCRSTFAVNFDKAFGFWLAEGFPNFTFGLIDNGCADVTAVTFDLTNSEADGASRVRPQDRSLDDVLVGFTPRVRRVPHLMQVSSQWPSVGVRHYARQKSDT